ncbi:MOSC domain-containing protein [Amycolatopsis thermophila]|uniref:MOSC domain-containing protein YiiM n=1 Tax=Amycolatopsis thermophila TaxID=206084 RepID=A0ABU0EX87_9PSEU|nr:MOSC domain-containing protein [Amycolatopsis thermophila]MDQ0379935.1 MOSC domain-containing protein YiiM [Amycolatopsis thermophila]
MSAGKVLSVNVGAERELRDADLGVTGIDKRPVAGPVFVAAPGPRGSGASGVAGDVICDLRHHGGDDQAVYAYAREDLDVWASELDRDLPPGVFGENLTTTGLDLTGALIGERWRVGSSLVLEVTSPRIPCRTFAGWLGERGWVKTFTRRAVPGAYFRVLEPGPVQAGDAVQVLSRPGHDATIALAFRAFTTEPALLPRLAGVEALPEYDKRKVRRALERQSAD